MNLNNILVDLNQHKSAQNREELLANYINERLQQSLQSYYHEIDSTFSYLSDKNDLKLLKKINNLENK